MYIPVYILFKQPFLIPIKVANWFIHYNCLQLSRTCLSPFPPSLHLFSFLIFYLYLLSIFFASFLLSISLSAIKNTDILIIIILNSNIVLYLHDTAISGLKVENPGTFQIFSLNDESSLFLLIFQVVFSWNLYLLWNLRL